MLTERIMYNALLKKDSSFEGIFFVAVKTTGIFCRPTCTARKPKKENVEFFDTSKDAILHGYRPCKVCTPLEKSGSMPDYIKKLIKEINDKPGIKIKDWHLRERGFEPNKIRRWFKKNHNMTFQSYQRMMRLNNAFTKIQSGGKVTDAAFDSGYESLSGFNDSFKTTVGKSPTKSMDKKVINITRMETPVGPMYACGTEKGICLFDFTDRRMLETEFKELSKYLNAVILPGDNKFFSLLKKEVGEYFEGKRKSFTVPLDAPGTEFQKGVWEELKKIPYGETISYKTQAERLKNPKGVRAVANANGHNRISILIPCHRVIGENGTLTGYGGGLWRKKWLLDFEKKNL
ncbi:MAG: bifunctional transcriptional activator/DNA repair protein Ada [Ignavibacteriae bacterium]|nr:bifunctional transcriptional activator/DNA repair protein Ada [Ignavibacteriota bacterium]